MWGLNKEINYLPARIIDGSGSVVATVGTGKVERVTLLDPRENEAFFQDGQKAEIEGTEEGFNLFQLNAEGEKQAIQPVGPAERIQTVKLVGGLTAEGITLFRASHF